MKRIEERYSSILFYIEFMLLNALTLEKPYVDEKNPI